MSAVAKATNPNPRHAPCMIYSFYPAVGSFNFSTKNYQIPASFVLQCINPIEYKEPPCA